MHNRNLKRLSHIHKTLRTLKGAFRAEILSEDDPERQRCEQELLESGVKLPLPHRAVWARSRGMSDSWFVAVRDRRGNRCVCGYAVEVRPSRVLPGHIVLSARRFGSSANYLAQSTGLMALQRLARRLPDVIRVDLELFSLDENLRSALCLTAGGLGFKADRRAGGYVNTIVIDLGNSVEKILASFHATARRHIRAVDKRAVTVRQIDDPAFVPRMEDLCRETMARTCGKYRPEDWERFVMLGHLHPGMVRVVGLFRDDVEGPESLVAFAIGLHHGDHAEYGAAASTRPPDLKIPLAYGLAWHLVRWAKANGAKWFDFGGITAGCQDDPNDPLGGISDFKRYFSKHAVKVCEHWVYEPRPFRAHLANTMVRLAEWGMRKARSLDLAVRSVSSAVGRAPSR